MFNGFVGRMISTSLFALAALHLGCEASPSSPTPPPGPLTLAVSSMSPNRGPTAGGTPVIIRGRGFLPGASVTLDGAAFEVSVFSEWSLTATVGAHAAGVVDVVVTNPGGESGRLAGGYTYSAITTDPAPSVTAISPNVGSIGGGTSLVLTGTGFQLGATVVLGGAAMRGFVSNSTTLNTVAPPRAAGAVEIVVINPDGQAGSLRAGYTYVPPGSLNFNGTWKGSSDDMRDDHRSVEMGFTIANSALTNVSCGAATLIVSPPLAVSNGEFSFSGEGGVTASGRILSPSAAIGSIHLEPCGPGWHAAKQ
jgi:large repetitive protein